MTPIEITKALTPEQFVAKGEELMQHQGIDITGCSGTVSKFGVSGSYTYDGATLKVEITSKPAFITEKHVEAIFNGWIDS